MFKHYPVSGGLMLSPADFLLQNQPEKAFVPQFLIYPLLQRNQQLLPVVAIGEPVFTGQLIAKAGNLLGDARIHAASSGAVSAIENRPIAHPSGLSEQCIVIKTDAKDTPIRPRPFSIANLNAAQLCQHIADSGIIGLGGGGFSSALKLQTRAKTLIINAVECEPEIQCDNALIQLHAVQLIQIAQLLMQILQFETCFIAIEEDMPLAKQCLQQAMTSTPIQLRCVPNLYPGGSEKQLIQRLTGKQVPLNGIPADIGVICLNVGTLFALYQAVYCQQPLIERLVTITGNGVKHPQNRWVKIGTPIAELISVCGGYTHYAERLIMGGKMMGIALADDAVPIVKTTNCVLVSSVAQLKPPTSAQACIRCGECAQVCPAQLLPQQLYWYSRTDNAVQLETYQLSACIECGCCDAVCPSQIPLVHYFRASKAKLSQIAQQTQAAALAKQRFETQQQRKQLQQAEQLALARKQKLAIEAMKAKMAAKRQSPE